MSSDLTKDRLRLKVYGYEICDHIREKYTLFKILVKLNQTEWIVDRRYNEFDRLNSEIKKENPDIKLHFPGKKIFGDNFDTDFIDKRMLKLDIFLNNTLNYPSILKMKCFKEFLEVRNLSSRGSNLNTEDDDFVLLGGTHNPVARPSDFDFLKVIGRGSFGKVYMANHKRENKIYAVKVLNKEAI
ncbi:serine threonine- kinase Sgk3, partial [Brachionus plicatilis]